MSTGTKVNHPEFIKLRDKGWGASDLAEHFGVTRTTILNHVKDESNKVRRMKAEITRLRNRIYRNGEQDNNGNNHYGK